MKFFQMSSNVGLYEFGIFLEDKPTDDQRAMLMQQVQAGQMNGMLDIEDAIIIQNTDNLKVAQQLLAYKVKKRREQEEDKAMRQQQMNAQVQQESAMVAEQAKQQTIQVEGQMKAQLIQVEKELDSKLLEMKYQYELQLEQLRQTGKVVTKQEENKGKKSVTKLKMGQPDDDVMTPQMMPSFREQQDDQMAEQQEQQMMEQQMMEQQMMDQEMQQQMPEQLS